MRAHAEIVARGTRLDLRCEPPITLRSTPDGVYLVGSAAGPVGGDDLHLRVDVGSGTRLSIRSAAAAMHHPAPTPAPSTFSFDVGVGPGCHLDWQPEPAIFVRGCDHRIITRMHLAASAGLLWREELVLGRHDEEPGSVLARLVVDRAGHPLIRNEVRIGPAWPDSDGPAGVGPARAVGSLLIVGAGAEVPCPPLSRGGAVRWAAMPLAPDAAMVVALAERPSAVTELLDAVVASTADHRQPVFV